jgi:hypothetical protein
MLNRHLSSRKFVIPQAQVHISSRTGVVHALAVDMAGAHWWTDVHQRMTRTSRCQDENLKTRKSAV